MQPGLSSSSMLLAWRGCPAFTGISTTLSPTTTLNPHRDSHSTAGDTGCFHFQKFINELNRKRIHARGFYQVCKHLRFQRGSYAERKWLSSSQQTGLFIPWWVDMNAAYTDSNYILLYHWWCNTCCLTQKQRLRQRDYSTSCIVFWLVAHRITTSTCFIIVKTFNLFWSNICDIQTTIYI